MADAGQSNGKRKLPSGVFIRPNSPHFWISWVDPQRRRHRKPVPGAASPSEAADIRSGEMFRAQQARVLGAAPPTKDSFQTVAARFLTHQKARLTPDAYAREKGIVEGHLKEFYKGKIGAIRRVDVQQYVTHRSGPEVSPYTVAKELNVLKHLLRLAAEWEVIPVSPAQGMKCPKSPAGRLRYLQPGEFRQLVEKCPEWLRPIVALGVTTGMRRGEILKMRWLDVDLGNGRVLLPQTKNGEGRIVYLNRTAAEALAALPVPPGQKPTDPVFPGLTPHQVSVAFRRAVKAAGIEDFRLHDLRHTAASWMRMKGADVHTVAQLLGHKDLRMAARYQHLSPAFLSDAVKSLDKVFGGKQRKARKASSHTGVTQTKKQIEGKRLSLLE